jgi:sirohydrochlorin cobaltochelatase
VNHKLNPISPETTALVLAGHGSHVSPHTAGLVWRVVDRLRAMGVADEITACFWKEAPSLHNVFDSIEARDITVVPIFTAQGYFTQTVLPAEMGLNGSVTERDSRVIRYARTLGEHAYVEQIVRKRVEDVLQAAHLKRRDVAVAVIGHGTRRSLQSRNATRRQVEALQQARIAAEVVDVYLDDEPEIADIYSLTSAPVIIAVPFFLAPGSHTTMDVPDALGLERGLSEGVIQGRHVYYTPPVGTDESITELVLELAREAGSTFDAQPANEWSSFPSAGRNGLVRMVEGRGVVVFGQLLLTPTEVCHVDQPGEGEIITTPAALRERVRESPFRTLPTKTDLPGGWRVPIHEPDMLHAVVETVYPGAVADWTAGRRDTFLPSTFKAVLNRQTGIYRQPLDAAKIENTVQQVCSGCIRYPAWYYGDLLPESIPCKEPCNVWLSAAHPQSEEHPA